MIDLPPDGPDPRDLAILRLALATCCGAAPDAPEIGYLARAVWGVADKGLKMFGPTGYGTVTIYVTAGRCTRLQIAPIQEHVVE